MGKPTGLAKEQRRALRSTEDSPEARSDRQAGSAARFLGPVRDRPCRAIAARRGERLRREVRREGGGSLPRAEIAHLFRRRREGSRVFRGLSPGDGRRSRRSSVREPRISTPRTAPAIREPAPAIRAPLLRRGAFPHLRRGLPGPAGDQVLEGPGVQDMAPTPPATRACQAEPRDHRSGDDVRRQAGQQQVNLGSAWGGRRIIRGGTIIGLPQKREHVGRRQARPPPGGRRGR